YGIGRLSDDAAQVRPLDLSPHESARGLLSLVERELAGLPLRETGERLETATLRPLPTVPHPIRNLFCVGKNYHEHAEEFSKSGFDSSAAAGAVPKAPIIFSKLPDCVVPHGAGIPLDPTVSQAVDYEAELAVIVGRGGRGISRSAAMEHVWGYTIVNDVTARDLQGRHSQWLLGKSQDGFCPMAPVAATADSFDLEEAMIRGGANGELGQQAAMEQLIFDVPTLIETISAGITLRPGDIIATGTPAGVGIGFDPPRYLAVGDRVRIEIDGIGELENPVVAYDAGRAEAPAVAVA